MFYLDEQGRFRIGSLFYEYKNSDWKPIWTIKDKDILVNGIKYPSLKAKYMSYDHVPGHEYDFAIDILDSWKHWCVLAESATLRDMIQEWRDELTIRLKSKAIKNLMKTQKDKGTIGLNANKYIANEEYLPKKVGRPSKAEKERMNKISSRVAQELEDDMGRMNLKVVSGGKE